VRVSVYHISLTKELSTKGNFSSNKLRNYEFKSIDEIERSRRREFRAGVKEAVLGYRKYLGLLKRNLSVNPLQAKSLLNHQLAELAEVEIEVIR